MSTKLRGLKKDRERSTSVLYYLKKANNCGITGEPRSCFCNDLSSKQQRRGEYITQILGISRIAVWKQVQSLRNYGYKISSDKKQGYRLVSSPDLLFPEEVQYELRTADLGKRVVYFPSIDSTNDYAKRVARNGEPHGTVIVAETQKRGRGRLGRPWFSPAKKNIYLSIILRPDVLPQEAPKLTLLAGLSVAEAIRKSVGVSAWVKWPNDIMVSSPKGNFYKAGGILTEMSAESDRINFAVIGIGLNVNMSKKAWPKELIQTAIGLKEAARLTENLSRVNIVREILLRLEENYTLFLAGGWNTLYHKYLEVEILIGKDIRMQQGTEVLAGRVTKIESDGGLVLNTKKGVKNIIAGDVTILKRK